jgi:hypothetical protein
MKDKKVTQVLSGGVGSVGGGKVMGEGEGGQIWWMYFVCVHENRTMEPVAIVLRRGD